MDLVAALVLMAGVSLLVWVVVQKRNTGLPGISDRSEEIVLGTMSNGLFAVPDSEFRLGKREQSYHGFFVGRSGSGKSRALQSIFLQHLNKGHGVGILEPHHDLSFDTLSYLVSKDFFKQKGAYKKLIYIDWANGDYVPFNVLAGNQPPHTVASLALDAMMRVWPELQTAPAFQTLFLSGVSTLIAAGLPITCLHQLITEKPFRDACLTKVTDPLVHQTFQNYEKLGKDQLQEAGSLLRRAFLLSFSPLTRYTLGQPENWLDFRRIIDDGRSIIINLGNIGDDETKQIIGALLMVQIEQAALSRTDLPPAKRTPFTLLVDEWASFAAQERTISRLLSQCRKFNLRLYLAGQSLSQVDSRRLAGALENCKLLVSFGLGRDSAVTQSHHLAAIDITQVKEPAATPNQHNQYMSVAEQFEIWAQQLQNLEPRYAYVKLEGREATLIKTVNMPDAEPDPAELDRVLRTYRRIYQRTQEQANEAIAKLAPPDTSQTPPTNGAGPAYTRVFS